MAANVTSQIKKEELVKLMYWTQKGGLLWPKHLLKCVPATGTL